MLWYLVGVVVLCLAVSVIALTILLRKMADFESPWPAQEAEFGKAPPDFSGYDDEEDEGELEVTLHSMALFSLLLLLKNAAAFPWR